MMLTPQLFAGIFTSDKVLVNYTAWALRIYMAGIFAMGFQVSCQQSFMALGQAKSQSYTGMFKETYIVDTAYIHITIDFSR